MSSSDNVQAFRAICNDMADTYEKKNADYGDSFQQSLDEFGLVAGIIRMSDKMNRIKQINRHGAGQVKSESVFDTLLDLACYAVMALVWLKNRNK